MQKSLSNLTICCARQMSIVGADGAPGPRYWQQKADYKIKCTTDTKTQRIDGTEAITYHNNSPVEMSYLWLQLDENEHAPTSSKHHMNSSWHAKNHEPRKSGQIGSGDAT